MTGETTSRTANDNLAPSAFGSPEPAQGDRIMGFQAQGLTKVRRRLRVTACFVEVDALDA